MPFTVNPEAQELHDAGLQAQLSGNYEQAHESFWEAQAALSGLPKTMDTAVQAARISRDNGFTYARQAIVEFDTAGLGSARDELSRSARLTAQFVDGGTEANLKGISRRDRKELMAEHGATISLMGRVATTHAVLKPYNTSSRVPADYYEQAHKSLRRGSNGYYRVSNAMVAARQERLNDRSSVMTKWLARAAVGVAWTAIRDRGNVKAAALTVISRLPHIRNGLAARNSVISKP